MKFYWDVFLLKGVARAPRLPNYLCFVRRPAFTVLALISV